MKKLLLAVGVLVLLSGCYPHRGSARDLGPEEMLAEAKKACQREDEIAARTLLNRSIVQFPKSIEALRANALLRHRRFCPKMLTEENSETSQ